MSTKAINERLKVIANDMATIETKDKKTDEDIASYKSLVEEGKKLRDQFDALAEGESLKAWMKEGDGQSAAKKTFVRQEVTSEVDREQEQRAQEAASKRAYKSSYEAYLRFGYSGMGDNDRKTLRGGRIYDETGQKAIGDGAANTGDFTIPEDFQAEVLKRQPGLIGLNDIVRKQPTTRDVLVWPKVTYTTDTKYTAPHRLTFTGKIPSSSTVHRVTDQTFGEARIPINLAMASQLVSNSLIEDSATDIIGLTTQLFNENIMQDVEYYLANGTGAGQPEGVFVNSTAQTNYVAGGGAATISTTSITNLYWGLPAQYRANAKWVFNSATGKVIGTMVDGNARFMWSADNMFGGNLSSQQNDGVVVSQPRLLGLPVVFSEHAPSVSTDTFPIGFGNFQGYIRGDRVGMTIRVLDELYAETDQKLFLLRLRFGGLLVEDYKIKLLKVSAS